VDDPTIIGELEVGEKCSCSDCLANRQKQYPWHYVVIRAGVASTICGRLGVQTKPQEDFNLSGLSKTYLRPHGLPLRSCFRAGSVTSQLEHVKSMRV
jgi:hypothetical protein